MAITGVGFGGALLNQSVFSLKTQLADLQTQLATGKKSTTYSGMGSNEGFAIAARTQLSNISSYTTTMTNVTTNISVTNTALDSYRKIASAVQTATGSGVQTVNGTGQTSGQQTAVGQFASMIGILNTQAGNRYVFSGSAIDTAPVASADAITNGTASQAGLKQLIAERKQADLGASGLGRLVIASPTVTSVQLAEDYAGSPYGMKLNTTSSTFTGATVTGPTGSPPAVSVDFGVSTPNSGEQVKFGFTLPDGSTESITLTASSATPLAAGSFAIGATPSATAANLNAALTTAVGKLANTALVAASAMQASDDFFNWSSVASGSATNSQLATPTPITGTTALSGTAGSDSLGSSFAPGDTITVNGTTISVVASGATGNQVNATDTVQTLLSKIDSITGTSTPSSVANGVVTLRGGTVSGLSVSSSNAAALGALGFSAPVSAQLGPVRVNGTPLSSATSSRAGTAADTVIWYTGESGSSPARGTAVARIDDHVTVNYGARANESAIRSALQAVAVMAAFTTSPTSSYAADQISGLNTRVTDNLSPPVGAQTIADIQSDLANAQVTMKDAQTRQSQAKLQLQTMVESTESVSSDEVATQLLALQTSLQASYQTTSMLSQLSLVKYL